jgi:hypothetical protein
MKVMNSAATVVSSTGINSFTLSGRRTEVSVVIQFELQTTNLNSFLSSFLY